MLGAKRNEIATNAVKEIMQNVHVLHAKVTETRQKHYAHYLLGVCDGNGGVTDNDLTYFSNRCIVNRFNQL